MENLRYMEADRGKNLRLSWLITPLKLSSLTKITKRIISIFLKTLTYIFDRV